MTESNSTRSLFDLESEAGQVGGDIETADYLLSGIIQDLGRDNETVHTVISACATLERAYANQEKLCHGLHQLIEAERAPASGESPQKSEGEAMTYSSLNPDERNLVDALRAYPPEKPAESKPTNPDGDRVQDATIYVLQALEVFRSLRELAVAEHQTPGCGHGAPENLADLSWAGSTVLQKAFDALNERPAKPQESEVSHG